jgi:hypothetical protein
MKTGSKSRRFAFHHQNEIVLFQFLLHECIQAHAILRNNSSPDILSDLIGNIDRDETIWLPQYGHIPRLRHYSTLLTTHFGNSASPFFDQLDHSIEKVYIAALHARTHDKNEVRLQMLYQCLNQELPVLLKLLFEKIVDYRDSPSILHFLLRHQEACDAACEEPMVKKIFSIFFPQGAYEAHAYLIDWFSKKGFEHLLPSIEEKLKKIAPLEFLQGGSF